ncbi:hypothetical protein ANCCEY_03660 [Ancylostoma ceylanicum]|uniref:ShKT domain-containing protein n=1 Tax=Ancylostoma ceylanicum TaxID=53326 RepID=A0A0D6LZP9_9BILA|nr:hypothetical protein ANCCEY_03660 [Ancylostoma ceylanicum]
MMRLIFLFVLFVWLGSGDVVSNPADSTISTTTGVTSATGTVQSTSTESTSTSAPTSSSGTTTNADCQDDPNVNCEKLKPQCADHRYNDLTNKYESMTIPEATTTTTSISFSTFYRYCARTCNRCAGPALPTYNDAADKLVF